MEEKQVISAESMSNVLTEYFRKKYSVEHEGQKGSSTLFIIVPKNVELVLLEEGYRSTVYTGNVDLIKTQKSNGISEKSKLVVCVKNYGEGRTIIDSVGKPYDRDLCRREGKGLEVLTPYVSCLPHLYEYSDKGENIRLILEYLGNNVLGKSYREFDKTDLIVLSEIVANQPVLQSGLDNRDYETIDELVRAGFLYRVPADKTKKLVVSERFSERFKIENGKLEEQADYEKRKFEIFEAGLDSIFEFQEAAKKFNKKLIAETFIPGREEFERLSRTTAKLKTILKYQAKLDGHVDYVDDSGGKGDLVKRLLKEAYIEEISHPIREHVKANEDIIQGDCHPFNMMVRDGKVVLTDLFHISFGPWLSDFVDYVRFLNLFCGLGDTATEGFYHTILGERMKLHPKGNDKEEFQNLRRRVELDRAIVAAGSLSGMLLNFEEKFNSYERKELKKRRSRYLGYIRNLLKIKTQYDEYFFARSKKFLEELLFKKSNNNSQ